MPSPKGVLRINFDAMCKLGTSNIDDFEALMSGFEILSQIMNAEERQKNARSIMRAVEASDIPAHHKIAAADALIPHFRKRDQASASRKIARLALDSYGHWVHDTDQYEFPPARREYRTARTLILDAIMNVMYYDPNNFQDFMTEFISLFDPIDTETAKMLSALIEGNIANSHTWSFENDAMAISENLEIAGGRLFVFKTLTDSDPMAMVSWNVFGPHLMDVPMTLQETRTQLQTKADQSNGAQLEIIQRTLELLRRIESGEQPGGRSRPPGFEDPAHD